MADGGDAAAGKAKLQAGAGSVGGKATAARPTGGVASGAPWEQLDELGEYRELCRSRLEHVVPVREPLVLCSQIQRSGGTLLSRLFDGHPECHAHPYELKLGKAQPQWPQIELADAPKRWFRRLYEDKVGRHLVGGYTKPGLKSADVEVFPFIFLPRLQKLVFDRCVAEWPIERVRDVFDCYFTSYFNAWLDNQNLYTAPKRIVTAFTPRTNLDPDSVRRFFEAYPDGALVTLVRDPRAWYGSAVRHRRQYEDLGAALELWRQSAEAALAAREGYGERAVVLTYEELVLEPESTMRRLAGQLGISWSPILLEPTFNGRPVRPNSSDAVSEYGVVGSRAEAWRDVLDADAIAQIDALAGDLYERAAACRRG
jgi:Sulfotransferase family